MRLEKLILGTSLIALLSACGGGDTPVQDNRPASTGLSASENVVKLASSNIGVELSEEATEVSQDLWDDAATLTYVARLDDGVGLVGVPMDDIATDVSFASTGSVMMYLLVGETQVNMTNGDVTGTISNVGELAVDVTGSAETTLQTGAVGTANLSVNMTTDTFGDVCGGAHAFCGGDLSVSVDGMDYTAALANENFIAGTYGTTNANAELGGMINLDPADTADGLNYINGSFIASQ